MDKDEHHVTKGLGIDSLKASLPTVFIGLVLVIALVLFVTLHMGDARQFVVLWNEASPIWLVISILLQIPTYLAAAAIWYIATPKPLRKTKLKVATLLSLEQMKISVDQLIPSATIAGHSIVLRSLIRLGVPIAASVEVVMIDILAYHAAYAVVTLSTLFLLWFYAGITPVIIAIAVANLFISVTVALVLLLLMFKMVRRLPGWLEKRQFVKKIYRALDHVSTDRILSIPLFTKAALLRVSIFAFDIFTLWAVMRSIGVEIGVHTAIITLVIASVAATVSFMPGGLGGFEIGSVAMLSLFGVHTEAALAGTLLFRGLAFWIPFIPGLILLRKEFDFSLR